MKKLLLLLPFILVACSNSSDEKKGDVPKSYSEIPYVEFDSNTPGLYVLGSGTSNYEEITLAYQESRLVTIKLRSQSVSSEIYKIVSPAFSAIDSSCIKKLNANDECEFSVNIEESVSGSVVLRMATSVGLKYMVLNVKRSEGPSGNFSIDQNVHVIGSVNAKTPVRRVITVVNEGSSPLTINVQRTGRDNVVLVQSNTCSNVKPRRRCHVIYRVHGINKTDGLYEDALSLSSGTTTHTLAVENVQFTHSTLPNVLPVISTSELKLVQAEIKSFSLSAVDEDGDSLTYGFTPNDNVVVSEFNSSNGTFKALVAGLGSYSLDVWVSDGKGPVVNKTLSVNTFPQLVMNKKSFTEGEVSDPLFSMNLNSGSFGLSSVQTDMSSVFTLIKISGTGSSYNTEPEALVGGTNFPLNGTASFNLNFAGAVKTAGSKVINVTVNFANGKFYTYPIEVEVASTGLPIVKYDLTLAKHSSHTLSNKMSMRTSLMNYIQETKRTYGTWRVPILQRFKYEDVVCNGSSLNTYEGTTDHDNCLRNRVSSDAESVFAFSRAYVGGDQIGGIALGLRSGAVISALAGRQTVLAHELGHNFGLWHTFESYFNSAIVQNDSSGLYNRNIYLNTTGSAPTIVGDFSNFIINPTSSNPLTLSWNYGIGDDTAIDFYSARRVAYSPVCVAPFGCSTQYGYAQGDIMFLIYGQDSSAVCQQTTASSPYTYPVYCDFNLVNYPSRYLEESVVKNVMSYWDKPASTSLFSNGQRLRMDNQINRYPVLSSP